MIYGSTGFHPHFLGWATEAVGFPVRALPTFETLETLKDLVAKYANRLAAQQWKLKKELFAAQLEISLKTGGGIKAFSCLREQPLPQVRDLKVVEELQLAPQRWLPTGKSWFHVVYHHVFSVGDSLCNGDLMVKVHKVIPSMSTNFSPEGKRRISAKISPLVTPMCGPPTFSPSGHNSGVVTIPPLLIKASALFGSSS